MIREAVVRSGSAHTAAYAMAALIVALSLFLFTTGGRVAYTMDSLTYRDAAQNILAGHAMAATNVNSETPERVPLLQWPPGYPALWALSVLVSGADIDRVPGFLAPLLLSVTTLSLFWLCLVVTKNPAVAGGTAVVAAFTPTGMTVFGHAWSEALFIPLVVLALACLWQYRDSGTPRAGFLWLAFSAALIAAANWTRYTGAIFLPLLGVSVLALSRATAIRRAIHALASVALSVALVAPLWLRNWSLTGRISGSDRGGGATHVVDRLVADIQSMVDLFEHFIFAYSMVLRAYLAVPLAAFAVFLIVRAWRRRQAPWSARPAFWVPLAWAVVNLLFLLYARVTQKDVDMDIRMLSVAAPFLLVAAASLADAVFSRPALTLEKAFVVVMAVLLVNTGWHESGRVRDNYLSQKAPNWRARFGLVYRDFTPASGATRALMAAIGPLPPATLVLTDFRALYIRYLTGTRAYTINGKADCAAWARRHESGVVLIGHGAWIQDCAEANPGWRTIVATGKAAPSMFSD